jgi:hypothetical protein
MEAAVATRAVARTVPACFPVRHAVTHITILAVGRNGRALVKQPMASLRPPITAFGHARYGLMRLGQRPSPRHQFGRIMHRGRLTLTRRIA